MHKHFVELACDPLSCKTLNPRQVWEELDQSMPYEGSIHCDVPPWPVSVRVLVSLALTALITQLHFIQFLFFRNLLFLSAKFISLRGCYNSLLYVALIFLFLNLVGWLHFD